MENPDLQQLNQALPELVDAINQVLAKNNLDALSVARIDFTPPPQPTRISFDRELNEEDNIIEPARAEAIENNIKPLDNIPICPPTNQIHGCIVCRDSFTGEIVHICRP